MSISLSKLDQAVGQKFGPSEWQVLSQQRIDTFAEATGDHQWIHVDPERARDGPYGATISHGYLTLSLCPSLLHEVFEVTERRIGINYGIDRLRFPSAVRSGSRLRLFGEVAQVEPVDGGTQVKLDLCIEIEGEERPACVVQAIYRYLA